MKKVLKEKLDYLKYKNNKANERYQIINQKKKQLAIENASRLEKLK